MQSRLWTACSTRSTSSCKHSSLEQSNLRQIGGPSRIGIAGSRHSRTRLRRGRTRFPHRTENQSIGQPISAGKCRPSWLTTRSRSRQVHHPHFRSGRQRTKATCIPKMRTLEELMLDGNKVNLILMSQWSMLTPTTKLTTRDLKNGLPHRMRKRRR